MPRMPKWIGDAMETVLASHYLSVTVISTDYLSPTIKKVSFQGEFENVGFAVGYAVAFRVDENNFRNYTIYDFEAERGTCEILFHLHNRGPGSEFAKKLMPGETIKMIAPRGKKLYQPDKKFHFVFGDETSLGLAFLLASECKKNGQQYAGLLEMSKENIDLPKKLGINIRSIPKDDRVVGRSAEMYFEETAGTHPDFFVQGIFYLTGKTSTIQVFLKMLKSMHVKNAHIKVQAYWAEGKTGL